MCRFGDREITNSECTARVTSAPLARATIARYAASFKHAIPATARAFITAQSNSPDRSAARTSPAFVTFAKVHTASRAVVATSPSPQYSNDIVSIARPRSRLGRRADDE